MTHTTATLTLKLRDNEAPCFKLARKRKTNMATFGGQRKRGKLHVRHESGLLNVADRYKQGLQLYDSPPIEELSLNDFEQFAAERLKGRCSYLGLLGRPPLATYLTSYWVVELISLKTEEIFIKSRYCFSI